MCSHQLSYQTEEGSASFSFPRAEWEPLCGVPGLTWRGRPPPEDVPGLDEARALREEGLEDGLDHRCEDTL